MYDMIKRLFAAAHAGDTHEAEVILIRMKRISYERYSWYWAQVHFDREKREALYSG